MKFEEALEINNSHMLVEEIIGNTAIVYHRGDKNKLDHLLKQTYSNSSHIDFRKYNKALYTTTNMNSQLNQAGNLNDMKSTYGDFIIKLAFKGVSNCWFCSYDEYKKYNNCTIDNWKEQQFKKFNIGKEDWKLLSGNNKNFTANHTNVSKFFEDNNLLRTRVKGIQYNGKYDGDCLLIYDWSTAVPLAISNNEGKTWEKIDKNKTAFQRSNFKNNDYIDTNKKIKYEFTPDKNGDIDCSYNKLTTLRGAPQKIGGSFRCFGDELTSLKGAPQEIGGDFICANNELTTLEGAPQKVGGSFDCSNNELTSLKGASQEIGGGFDCSFNNLTTLEGSPQKVGRNFVCSFNNLTSLKEAPQEISGGFNCKSNKNLPKEEIIKYLKVTKIDGGIYTDFGTFSNKEEALKNLTATKYFPY